MKKYDSYKKPIADWVDEIPSHWKDTRIKYLALDERSLFLDGDWIESKVIIEDGIRYITTGNVKAGYYSEQGNGHISETTFSKLNCTEVFEGDLLLSRLNLPIGRACIVPNLGKRIVTSVDNVIFRPDKEANKRYLLHLFSSKEYFEHNALTARGATMQRISRGLLGDVRIFLPPLSEQTQIANYLDHKTTAIDQLIEKKEKLITLLKEERTAVINQAVTKGLDPNVPMKDSGIEWLGEIPEHWEVSRISFLTSRVGDGLHGTPKYVEESLYPFINGSNIDDGEIIITERTKFVSQEEYSKNKKVLTSNTILMSINGTIGNLAFYNGETIMLGKSAAYINLEPNVNKEFVYYFLKSSAASDYINKELSGSTIKNLSLNSIDKTPIPYPKEKEQKLIVSKIKNETLRIDEILLKSEQEIELLKEYKTALISEVVTGKVDVRDEELN